MWFNVREDSKEMEDTLRWLAEMNWRRGVCDQLDRRTDVKKTKSEKMKTCSTAQVSLHRSDRRQLRKTTR
jgi:hypothetical protein